MLVKKWKLILLYMGRLDWGTENLTIIEGMGGGGHFPTKVACRARHLTIFPPQMPGVCPGEDARGWT